MKGREEDGRGKGPETKGRNEQQMPIPTKLKLPSEKTGGNVSRIDGGTMNPSCKKFFVERLIRKNNNMIIYHH